MGLSLRPAVAEDDAFSFKVYASTRAQEMAVVPWTDEQKQSFLEQQFNAQRASYLLHSPGAEWLIILRDDEAIGRMIVDRSSSTIELMDIALLPEFRNVGIGSSFVNDLLKESRETGKPVALYVEQYNPALNLYARMGFKVTREEGVYFAMEWIPPTGTKT
jgi:ribosomal protein S18 acetylase RimI-like enzyme